MCAKRSGETSLAKVDNPPRLALRETAGHLLRRCHQIAVGSFLEQCRAFDLTPPQYVTLSALATHGPLDKATIGDVVALDRTTIAVVVKNLEERGFVTTRPSDQDRRSKLVKITAKGLNLLPSVQIEVARAQERTLAPLSPKERVELVRLLRKIAEENNLLSRAPLRRRPIETNSL
jgi:MarR family transcriptional regulator, lower aerobic nicotinate degradation pathway regulator